MLVCDEQQPAEIEFRAKISSYGSNSVDQIVGYIEDWVTQGANATTGNVVLTFYPTFPIIASDELCPTSTVVIISPSSTVTNITTIIAIGVTIAAVSSILMIVIVTFIIVFSLVVQCRPKSKNRSNQ